MNEQLVSVGAWSFVSGFCIGILWSLYYVRKVMKK